MRHVDASVIPEMGVQVSEVRLYNVRVPAHCHGAGFAGGVTGADGAKGNALLDVQFVIAAVADENDSLVEAAIALSGEMAHSDEVRPREPVGVMVGVGVAHDHTPAFLR